MTAVIDRRNILQDRFVNVYALRQFALRRMRGMYTANGYRRDWRLGAVMWWAWVARLHDSASCRTVATPRCWR